VYTFTKRRKGTYTTLREQPDIPEEHLRACLQEQYDIYPDTLEYLPRGHDYSAGVYRVVSEQGTAYLLKATARPLYEPGLLVPRYLRDQGITSVVAPMPTKNNTLWSKLAEWTVIVYPWIDGVSSLTGMTNEQWKEVGSIFKQIHSVRLQPDNFPALRKEAFDPAEYTRWVHTFETQHLHSQYGESESARALRASWVAHQSVIHSALSSLEKLAEVLQSREFKNVTCHADLHPANLLRDQHGGVFVIDWDEVMLAPKERDFIFIREPQAGAFREGYGQVQIDWTLLSYCLWERVVQDWIEDARNVCFRDDLTEENKADIARTFDKSLSKDGNNIAAAYQASARINAQLRQ
jgi:spectinomycin phosphotransferase